MRQLTAMEAYEVADRYCVSYKNVTAGRVLDDLLSLLGTEVICLIASGSIPHDPFYTQNSSCKTAQEEMHEHMRPFRRPPHPGKIAEREQLERGWTTDDLAARLHEPVDWVVKFLSGDLSVMYDIDFYHLADAFGTSIGLWRKLYTSWRDYEMTGE